MNFDLPTRRCAKKAPSLMILLLPLAVVTIAPAKANIVHLDPNNSDSCAFTGLSGGCIVTQASSPAGGNSNLNWLQLSGQGSAGFSNGLYSIEFDANGGSDNGFLPGGPVPVSWDFFVNGTTAVNWTVSFTLGLQQTSTNYFTFTQTGTAAPGAEVSGIGSIAFSGGGTPVFYDMSIQLNSASAFTANVPAGSTEDFNPIIAAPEPGSAALMTAGAALFALYRKTLVRRRKAFAAGIRD